MLTCELREIYSSRVCTPLDFDNGMKFQLKYKLKVNSFRYKLNEKIDSNLRELKCMEFE